ncbi:hypothetical protein SSPS47_27080 [Streptomyces sp. S4.7]|nr:hypothetical protein SSPS47_27080 [Streptomyces sp. S4.7]
MPAATSTPVRLPEAARRRSPRTSRATVSTAPVATAEITAAFVDSKASVITNTATGTVE